MLPELYFMAELAEYITYLRFLLKHVVYGVYRHRHYSPLRSPVTPVHRSAVTCVTLRLCVVTPPYSKLLEVLVVCLVPMPLRRDRSRTCAWATQPLQL